MIPPALLEVNKIAPLPEKHIPTKVDTTKVDFQIDTRRERSKAVGPAYLAHGAAVGIWASSQDE
jgi:hypothetical protein